MPVVKGGVWTNIEDEILKASVSKYGLNQWARVSSLLARKTPKQCKARWNEWLDPSIKKIEWSKEEDERLLHLAKLMPTQWRTIAPIVGRTANQCLERYQKLLDDAEQREAAAADLGLTGVDGVAAPSADEVRRLRPGEVDPDPEAKPARPDTIDLDEDEKEMLSEARARLANTQGKKAKRKARERQQEESRRLATLQKRRELKLAGINIKVVTHKKGQMDYNADVAFEKAPTMGFFDTSEEIDHNTRQTAAFDPKKQPIQSKRKGGEPDKGDETERKKRKGGEQQSASVQAAMKAGAAQRQREAEQAASLANRRAFVLPAPQVSDGELEEIVKMGLVGERASRAAQERSDNDATRGFVQDYSSLTPAAGGQPIRTPRAPPRDDHIANEIRNIRALTETQSTLLGGENAPLTEGAASTGFDGIAPRRAVVATPNPMATPLRAAAANGMTPARGNAPGQTPLRTPARDSFSLNSAAGDAAELSLPGGTPADERLREHATRHALRQGLASLPAPKDTEWELELPDEDEGVRAEAEARRSQAERDGLAALEADQARRDREDRLRAEAAAELERRRRSQPVQRGLPRPAVVDLAVLLAEEEELPAVAPVQDKGKAKAKGKGKGKGKGKAKATKEDAERAPPDESRRAAERLVLREMAALVAHDAQKFPPTTPDGCGVPNAPATTIKPGAVKHLELLLLPEESGKRIVSSKQEEVQLEQISDDDLAEARLLVLMEAGDSVPKGDDLAAAVDRIWGAAGDDAVDHFMRGLGCEGASDEEQVKAMRAAFDTVQASIAALAEADAKLEKKLNLHLGGYAARAKALRAKTAEAADDVAKAANALAGFRTLAISEDVALRKRLDALRDEVAYVSRRERQAQEAYRSAREQMMEGANGWH